MGAWKGKAIPGGDELSCPSGCDEVRNPEEAGAGFRFCISPLPQVTFVCHQARSIRFLSLVLKLHWSALTAEESSTAWDCLWLLEHLSVLQLEASSGNGQGS